MMFKDFFNKPIRIVAANDIRQGDYVHSISDPDCSVEIEKRKGYIVEIAASPTTPQITKLKLTNRLTSLKVPASATAVITRKKDIGKEPAQQNESQESKEDPERNQTAS